MRRTLVVLAVALALAAGVVGVSGVFSSAGSKPPHVAVVAASPAQMTMPMPSTGLTGKATVELHRAVVQVKISNFAFKPARIVVSPGTKVVWTNEDSDPHTVTTDKPGFSSQALDTGSHYAEVIRRAGTYTYHCTIHPFMHGAVVVQG
ncbi:MAG TPA: cupredoxin domain-containing protein [Solirubrobacteraceae bacterium]|nr:cupredoxin domain-containing protein [Solirubrobacteraceae bacterium]